MHQLAHIRTYVLSVVRTALQGLTLTDGQDRLDGDEEADVVLAQVLPLTLDLATDVEVHRHIGSHS